MCRSARALSRGIKQATQYGPKWWKELVRNLGALKDKPKESLNPQSMR